MVSKSMVPPETGFLFEGVCLNYRHPDPRRAWKGGSEQQSMTPDPRDPRDPRDPGDPGDPLMNSQPMIPFEAVLKKSLGRRYRVMFF